MEGLSNGFSKRAAGSVTMSVTPSPTARQQEIKQAALRQFARRGYHGTGMEDIARFVGMRASSLYKHVSSKQDILEEIMMTTVRELLALLEGLPDPDLPAARLREAMERHIRYQLTHRLDVIVANHEINSVEEPARTRILQLRKQYERGWSAIVQGGIERGVFDCPSPVYSVFALAEMGMGLTQWYVETDQDQIADVARHYGLMALRLVGAASAQDGGADRA